MKALFLLFFSTTAFAKGNGHPMDLIPSFVNIALLIGLIVYFAKDTLRAHFKKRSEDTKEIIERAASKAKEAQAMMEIQEKKMKALDSEIVSIKMDADSQLKEFDTDYKNSLTSRIAELKTDASQKIEAEKKSLLDDLNSTLLDQVISKSKVMIKADSSLNSDAAKKMIEGLK